MKYPIFAQQIVSLLVFNFFAVSLFAAEALPTDEPAARSERMITVRVGPNGSIHFVYGDGSPASVQDPKMLEWQAITSDQKKFGDMQFLNESEFTNKIQARNSVASPPRDAQRGGHRGNFRGGHDNYRRSYNGIGGYWGGYYYPNYYPQYYPYYYGYNAYPTYPYVCGTYRLWPFIYYNYCW